MLNVKYKILKNTFRPGPSFLKQFAGKHIFVLL